MRCKGKPMIRTMTKLIAGFTVAMALGASLPALAQDAASRRRIGFRRRRC
jgi:Amt family ammonium transporter